MEYQKTIAGETTLQGIGVHSGIRTTLTIKPAPEDHGISFHRTDLPENPRVNADLDAVTGTAGGTTLGMEGGEVRTVEHLLAALSAMGIDNLLIELDGPEVPILDGSSLPFIEMIRRSGLKELNKPRKTIILSRPVYVIESGMILAALPSDELRIACTVAYNHPVLQSQYLSLPINQEIFENEVAPARTFGFLRDALFLMKRGLIKGTSLDNTLVIGDDNIFSRGGLRFRDEFVRHKILDLIGDLSLLGGSLKAMIIAVKSGHDINIKLAKKIREAVNER